MALERNDYLDIEYAVRNSAFLLCGAEGATATVVGINRRELAQTSVGSTAKQAVSAKNCDVAGEQPARETCTEVGAKLYAALSEQGLVG